MFKQKLKHRFISRSAVLKKRSLWPFLPNSKQATRKGQKPDDADEDIQSETDNEDLPVVPSPRKEFNFNYAEFKPILDQRVKGAFASKNKKKKK